MHAYKYTKPFSDLSCIYLISDLSHIYSNGNATTQTFDGGVSHWTPARGWQRRAPHGRRRSSGPCMEVITEVATPRQRSMSSLLDQRRDLTAAEQELAPAGGVHLRWSSSSPYRWHGPAVKLQGGGGGKGDRESSGAAAMTRAEGGAGVGSGVEEGGRRGRREGDEEEGGTATGKGGGARKEGGRRHSIFNARSDVRISAVQILKI